jgi:hypothetical protein
MRSAGNPLWTSLLKAASVSASLKLLITIVMYHLMIQGARGLDARWLRSVESDTIGTANAGTRGVLIELHYDRGMRRHLQLRDLSADLRRRDAEPIRIKPVVGIAEQRTYIGFESENRKLPRSDPDLLVTRESLGGNCSCIDRCAPYTLAMLTPRR